MNVGQKSFLLWDLDCINLCLMDLLLDIMIVARYKTESDSACFDVPYQFYGSWLMWIIKRLSSYCKLKQLTINKTQKNKLYISLFIGIRIRRTLTSAVLPGVLIKNNYTLYLVYSIFTI